MLTSTVSPVGSVYLASHCHPKNVRLLFHCCLFVRSQGEVNSPEVPGVQALALQQARLSVLSDPDLHRRRKLGMS